MDLHVHFLFVFWVFYIPHISEIIQYFSFFSVWFISLNIMLSRSVHIGTNVRVFFFCKAELNIYTYIFIWVSGFHFLWTNAQKWNFSESGEYHFKQLSSSMYLYIKLINVTSCNDLPLLCNPRGLSVKNRRINSLMIPVLKKSTNWKLDCWIKIYQSSKHSLIHFCLTVSNRKYCNDHMLHSIIHSIINYNIGYSILIQILL